MVLVVIDPLSAVPVRMIHVVTLFPLIMANIIPVGLLSVMVIIAMVIIMMVLCKRQGSSQARTERGNGKQTCNSFHRTSPRPC